MFERVLKLCGVADQAMNAVRKSKSRLTVPETKMTLETALKSIWGEATYAERIKEASDLSGIERVNWLCYMLGFENGRKLTAAAVKLEAQPKPTPTPAVPMPAPAAVRPAAPAPIPTPAKRDFVAEFAALESAVQRALFLTSHRGELCDQLRARLKGANAKERFSICQILKEIR